MRNVSLIGMPGSGKSTVGVLLAKELGFSFVDTDLLIQRQDRHSARVEHHLPGRPFPIGQLRLVHQQGHDLPLKNAAALQRAFCQIHRNDRPLCAALSWALVHTLRLCSSDGFIQQP